MKYVTIYQDQNKIELHNSILGKETIKVNDEIVSSKYSFFGKVHHFMINQGGKQLECKLTTSYGLGGIQFDFAINGNPVIETPKNQWMRLVVVFIIAIAFFILLDFLKK